MQNNSAKLDQVWEEMKKEKKIGLAGFDVTTIKGEQGNIGPQGPQGPQGIQGIKGKDSFVPGPQGPRGPRGRAPVHHRHSTQRRSKGAVLPKGTSVTTTTRIKR